MNVARLNFSHGTHAYHKETMDRLKRVRQEENVPLAILLDTRGPEIRVKDFKNGEAFLEEGAAFALTTREIEGDENAVTVTYAGMPRELRPGNSILIDDGNIELNVDPARETDVICRVIHGGRISNHKGINVPNVHLELPFLSDQDKADILFGIENDVDFVAASFVRCKEDVIALRKFVDYHGARNLRIISKIENIEASTTSTRSWPIPTASWSPAGTWASSSPSSVCPACRSASSRSATRRARSSSPQRRCSNP